MADGVTLLVLVVLLGLLVTGWLAVLVRPAGEGAGLAARRPRWAWFLSVRIAVLASPLVGGALVLARLVTGGDTSAAMLLFTFVFSTVWFAVLAAAEVALCAWWERHRPLDPCPEVERA